MCKFILNSYREKFNCFILKVNKGKITSLKSKKILINFKLGINNFRQS